MKAARVEAARAQSTFTMAAVEARKLAGDVVPMDASPAGAGKIALTLRVPIGVVGAISPFNFPFNLVAHKVAPALAAGLRRRAQARVADAALRAAPRGARARSGPARRLAQRRRRAGLRDRRRARRRRPRLADHVHGLLGRRLEAARASASQARQPRARERDARDRRRRRGSRRRRDAPRRERVLLRRPELHLRSADLRRAHGVRRVPRALPSSRRMHSSSAIRPTTTRTSGRSSRRTTATACSRGSRRHAPRCPHPHRRRSRRRATPTDRRRRRAAGREGLVRGGLRPALHGHAVRLARRGDRARQRNALRPPGGHLHERREERPFAPRRSSSSAASRSTRHRRSGPTRCPTEASRTRATRAKGRRMPSAR